MPDANAKNKRQQQHQANHKSIHHWFWQDFMLHPVIAADNSSDSDKKTRSHERLHDWARAMHESGKTAAAGSPCLHQWFWQDFAVAPRSQGAHKHENHLGASDWCLHDCAVLNQE
jgi:hypothetical protein